MKLNHQTWRDHFAGAGQVGFEVVIVDDYSQEIEVEGILIISKSNEVEIVLKNVGGNRKFNSLQFGDKYRAYESAINKYIEAQSSLLESHLQIIKDHTFKKLGCYLSEAPEYYETANVGDFIMAKNSLDSSLEIMSSQGATYNSLFKNHPMKFQIDEFMFQYNIDLKKVNKVLNKEILKDLSPQYLSRMESLKVGEILSEEKMELLPMKLMSVPVTLEETKGTIIPFELFILKYSKMAVKLGLLVANKFFKQRGFPMTNERFFSFIENERTTPTIDKSVLAQTHTILHVALQGLSEGLENMNGIFTNLHLSFSKERVVTFPTPSNADLDNSLVYAIMTLEEYKGRPLKQLDHSYFSNQKAKAA